MGNRTSTVHHVVGLLRPENFHHAISQLSMALQTSFFGPFQRAEAGINVAVSMEAGIELIAPLSSDPTDPIMADVTERGERWISVAVAVRSLDDACDRLEQLGHKLRRRGSVMNAPMPFSDRLISMEQASFDPAAFGGLPVLLMQVEKRFGD